MHLYNLTLKQSQVITKAVYGSFSSEEAEEILLVHNKSLEITSVDDSSCKLNSIFTWECFGIIRSVHPFRIAGSHRDYIALGTDSGAITILRYNPEKSRFEVVQNEIFGKTGCRRIVPGQYLASDPQGRAIMIGAIEKQKLVYIIDRDSEANLIISSPLEAHKASTICFDMVGIDVEYENPLFACLEIDFSALEDVDLEADERVARKIVTFYELDLGLNTVVRKQLVEVDPQSNRLLAVPGGDEGPGGVLVFSMNWVVYISEDQEEQVRAPFPRRSNVVADESRDLLISAVTTHCQKGMFFFLAQSELGDLYKITIDFDKDEVNNVFVEYFDTIPVAGSLCITRQGFLFAASEVSDSYLFTFKSLGNEQSSARADQTSKALVYFEPSPLKNLALAEEIPSLAPIINMKLSNIGQEQTPQIYTLCGKGSRSSLRVLRHGLEVTEMAISDVPGTPSAVWSIKKNSEDDHHSYIVVAFASATLVLSIGEVVEEVTDSGFLLETTTLCAASLGQDSLLQAHSAGIRIICADGRINEWKPPNRKTIYCVETNGAQVAVLLTGGELVVFAQTSGGALSEVLRSDMGAEATCLGLAAVPEGLLRARFLAVGSSDKRVRLLDLENQGDDLEPRLASTQILDGAASALVLSPSNGYRTLTLFVGTTDGRMVTSNVDLADGRLSPGRQRYLGGERVKLFNVMIEHAPAVLALSSRSWLSYHRQSQSITMPLAYAALEHAAAFSSEQCPEGVVSICGRSLRIWSLERLGEFFCTTKFPLRYTPRALCVHPVTNNVIVAEAEINTMNFAERKEMAEMISEVQKEKNDKNSGVEKNQGEINSEDKQEENGESKQENERNFNKEREEEFKGVVATDQSNWGSCIRIMDSSKGKTVFLHEFEENIAVFSIETIIFQNHPNEIFLVAGTAKNVKFNPKSADNAHIRVYRFFENHSSFKLLHKTEVNDIPLALCAFQGHLLAGVGNVLRLYELGKRKLLRKSENRQFVGAIRKIHCSEGRIFVSDMTAGTFLLKFSPVDKSLKIFADSINKFYTTAAVLIDHDTIASGDKFGNISISRLDYTEDDQLKSALEIPYGGYLNAAGVKLTNTAFFFTGETISSMAKAVLNPGGSEVVLYSTLLGTIGCLYPLRTREDVEFFVHLETHMRHMSAPVTGRRHVDYRSTYFPIKAVVDGDLCEQFSALEEENRERVAREMVMDDPAAIQKRIEIVRSHII